MVIPSSSIPWSVGGCAREPPYPDCVVVKCSGQREFWKEQGWRSWVPALSCPPSPLPNSSSTFWQVRHDSPTEQFQLWNKSEQFPGPEYDAITEKKKKKEEKKRTLSPSRVMGGKQFEQFCSTDRGNVSFANSSGVLAPQEHSQAQEVSHKPETEAWWGRNLSVSHLALQKLSKLLLTLNFKL